MEKFVWIVYSETSVIQTPIIQMLQISWTILNGFWSNLDPRHLLNILIAIFFKRFDVVCFKKGLKVWCNVAADKGVWINKNPLYTSSIHVQRYTSL